MKRLFMIATAMVAAAMIYSAAAYANDAYINATFSKSETGTVSAQSFTHDDLEPFKGSANITVTNDTDEYWNGLHLGIFSVSGSNISKTIFVDGTIDGVSYNPTSSQGGLSWVINNNPAGATMDLFFTSYVAPGSTATFKVYTDNTTYRQKFGIMVYPTAVPEPSSYIAFFTGIIGLVGYATRRRD